MNVTIDLKVLAWLLVAIALLVLIIYLIQVVRRLIVTLEHTNKILTDVEAITEIAAERTKDVDAIVETVTESISAICDAAKGHQNVFLAIAAIIKAAASIKGLFFKEKSDKEQ